jgi:hypothetical protein
MSALAPERPSHSPELARFYENDPQRHTPRQSEMLLVH